MNKTEGTMEKLQRVVKAGRERLEKHGDLNLGYVERFVIPALDDVLQNLCLEIEERHKIDPEVEKDIDVIHYTSIGTLVSMLQQEAKNRQNKAKDEENKAKDEQNATEDEQDVAKDEQESSKDEQNTSLRLYDSVHFNDPDEGNYFFRNLPKKYAWLGEKKESHAYIASFIFPATEKNSDNLVFWRTYGKEGEGCSLKLRIPRDQLRKVLYGSNKVKCTGKELRPVLEAIHPLVSIGKQLIKKNIRKELSEAIWKSLERICYLYKSEAYEHERECRFIIYKSDIDENRICFEYKERDNSPRIRHYYQDEALAIEKILSSGSAVTLGPRVPYRSDVSNCLEIMMDRAELKYRPQIKISKIFYRKP